MIISHSRRFTFVHIHKAGGTSVEKALDPHLAWNDLILGSSALGQGMHDPYSARHQLYKHSSVAQIEGVCGTKYTDDFYLFAVVRHPIDRVCSLYNFIGSLIHNWKKAHGVDPDIHDFKVSPEVLKKAQVLRWPASRAFRASPSFSEFIRHADLDKEDGFRTQTSRLTGAADGKLKGEIFRLEDGATLAGKISSRLGLEFQLLHENKSEMILMDREKLSSEDRLWLEEKFRDDFAAFGY